MSYYTSAQAATIPWDKRWARAKIPARFRGLGIQTLRLIPENVAGLKAARDFVETFHDRYAGAQPEGPQKVGRGLLIVGPQGTGKTRIACALATDVHLNTNHGVLYLPVTEYFHISRNTSNIVGLAEKTRDPELLEEVKKAREFLRRVERVPLLVWDDLGKEYSTGNGWVGTEVHRVLRERFDRGFPTVLTTNILQEEINGYDRALGDFIHEAFDTAVINGKSWRRAG